jgi:hypothetical protein
MLCHGRSPAVADVDAVYDHLLSSSKKQYFDYWHQRLREELGTPDDGHAVALLNAIAADPAGASTQTLQGTLGDGDRLTYLLDVLNSDGYVVEQHGRYLFRSSLLRDFWRRHIT